ncbi:MAG: macro domain-containing protein [Ruminococcus sp.]|nr:macro domain-containing protein [Ruminococcus sp.]
MLPPRTANASAISSSRAVPTRIIPSCLRGLKTQIKPALRPFLPKCVIRIRIVNCIHTYAGIQLRNKCGEIMRAQGYEEPTGMAKITPAYNLPCDYVLHTVGPIVRGRLSEKDCDLLKSCYLSCLRLAEENGVKSVAFCCISTGVFGFPQQEAAQIAVATVREYQQQSNSGIKVIFNVFKDDDLRIYQRLLG